MRQYAAWVIKRRFTHAAENSDASVRAHHARSELVEIRRFLDVVRGAKFTLQDAPQRLYDQYAADRGRSARDLVTFVRWARSQHLTRLRGSYGDGPLRGPAISEDQRWAWVRMLMTDEGISLNARVAGLLAFVFGVPMSRIVALRRDAVKVDGDRVLITFGADAIEVPDTLARLTRRLLATPSRSPIGEDVWLFRGVAPGAHLSRRAVSAALQPAGISLQQGRLMAIMTLSRDVQAAIVADLVGVRPATAARWSAHAGGDWATYPRLRLMDRDEL